MVNQKELEELEDKERKEHNQIYQNSKPFNFVSYEIDPDKVFEYQDYCYKPNTRPRRGSRTKKMFEEMNVWDLEGKRILDVGCGNGQYSVLFALMGAEVCGVDISTEGISVAREIAKANNMEKKCNFSVQNANDLDFPNGYFDIIVFHEALHHVIKYSGFKEEISRVLKSNGEIIASEGVRGNPIYNFFRFFYRRIVGEEPKGDVDMKYSDLEQFAKGFENKKINMFSLFFMMSEVLGPHSENRFINWILRTFKRIDDFLLNKFSYLEKYCGHTVIHLKSKK